jgi:hypothetical protein
MVHLCKGRAVQAVVLGSHFKLRGFAKRFAIHLPDGASGALNGQFRRDGDKSRGGAEERSQRREQKEQNAPIPTVAQLAAMLAAAMAG